MAFLYILLLDNHKSFFFEKENKYVQAVTHGNRIGDRTLRTQDTSNPRHFGIIAMVLDSGHIGPGTNICCGQFDTGAKISQLKQQLQQVESQLTQCHMKACCRINW